MTYTRQPIAIRRIVACLGWSCLSKDRCAHYYAPGIPGRDPVGRLCTPGRDEPEPMGVVGTLLPEKKA